MNHANPFASIAHRVNPGNFRSSFLESHEHTCILAVLARHMHARSCHSRAITITIAIRTYLCILFLIVVLPSSNGHPRSCWQVLEKLREIVGSFIYAYGELLDGT